MAIKAQSLKEDAARELGVGFGSEHMAASFVRAVNRTLDELSIKADKATRFSHITSEEDSITIDNEYEYIIYAGVIYNLIRMGHKPADPRVARVVYEDSLARWKQGWADYVVEDNDTQSDSSEDIIALGSLE